ncbi:MAG: phosphoribosylformylglycinamidine synthase subunit PurQ [Planctomycetota bacterium]
MSTDPVPVTDRGGRRPVALLVRAAGTNCGAELARAFRLAGAAPTVVHLDRLLRDPGPIAGAEIIAFPGGFSFGDDIASGRVFAMHVRTALGGPLREAVGRGARVLGVCNGFQILVQSGLLPGWDGQERAAALVENEQGRFIDRWVRVEYPSASRCVWTKGLAKDQDPETQLLPIANGEGRFVADDDGLARLERAGQIAVRYAEPTNGSAGDVAGICDPTGRVLGLMPHPERYLDWNRHPFWTSLPSAVRSGTTPGLRLFENAVRAEPAALTQG